MLNEEISEEEIKQLLTHTKSLINNVFIFRQDFDIQPQKEHIGTSIKYTDIRERRDDFLLELTNTILNWVYSKQKIKQILSERISETNCDDGYAYNFLVNKARSKFRSGYPQGQFGELLLFNFIQYFFGAVPLVRKQRITTSSNVERFGADAIHFKKENGHNVLILGEAKCYTSKSKFNAAFTKSLNSIFKTYYAIDREFGLYTYEDFIEPELESIVKKYKSNTLENVQFELVCIIAYNETNKINGTNEEEIRKSIESIIRERCENLDSSIFENLDPLVLTKVNYIIFPIWKLDELLDTYMKEMGL